MLYMYRLMYLIVNNYEISVIHKCYLNLWKKNRTISYIDATIIFNYFDLDFTDIFKKYFLIFQNKVSIHNFVVFVCIFIFGDTDDILRILLSVCGVHSNVAISYFHCLNLIKSIHPNALTDEELSKWISNQQTTDIISIHDFTNAIKSSVIIDYLDKIKDHLIEKVLGSSNYETICKRSYYYNNNSKNNTENNSDNNTNINELFNENCFTKFIRILCHKPPPLFTEYHTLSSTFSTTNNILYSSRSNNSVIPNNSNNNNNNSNYESVIALIRGRYGYSRRHTSSSHKDSLRRRTISSGRSSYGHTKYVVKVNGVVNTNKLSDTPNASINQGATE